MTKRKTTSKPALRKKKLSVVLMDLLLEEINEVGASKIEIHISSDGVISVVSYTPQNHGVIFTCWDKENPEFTKAWLPTDIRTPDTPFQIE